MQPTTIDGMVTNNNTFMSFSIEITKIQWLQKPISVHSSYKSSHKPQFARVKVLSSPLTRSILFPFLSRIITEYQLDLPQLGQK